MANLFVVFTPLQIVIAQQIIVQEKLKDNIMLESYFPGYSHFLDIYELVVIEDLWQKVIPFDNWAYWDYGGKGLIRNSRKVWKRYKELAGILKKNQVEKIYLADYQNQTNRFTCILLSHQGYKIGFFEEGYSHYIPRPEHAFKDDFLHRFYVRLLDYCYYQPLYHINFAKWRCSPNRDYHGLPIDVRYSMIPNEHHEPYDKVLNYTPMISPKLKRYIEETTPLSNGKSILLLTDPMTEVLDANFKHLYFECIEDSLSKFQRGYSLYIKYHPRDSEKDRKYVQEIAQKLNIDCEILGSKVNIPVELYLQTIHFDAILFFNTSTYFYNGYMFPKSNFIKLLPLLYRKCIEHHVPNTKQIELILKKIEIK